MNKGSLVKFAPRYALKGAGFYYGMEARRGVIKHSMFDRSDRSWSTHDYNNYAQRFIMERSSLEGCVELIPRPQR
jgi:hypothetical protein